MPRIPPVCCEDQSHETQFVSAPLPIQLYQTLCQLESRVDFIALRKVYCFFLFFFLLLFFWWWNENKMKVTSALTLFANPATKSRMLLRSMFVVNDSATLNIWLSWELTSVFFNSPLGWSASHTQLDHSAHKWPRSWETEKGKNTEQRK